MTTPKLDEIREQEAEEEAHQGGRDPFDNQWNARGVIPAGVTYARDLAEQPRSLRSLKVVAGSRQHQLPCERSVMDPRSDASRRIIRAERLLSASFKLNRKAISGAEWPVPNGNRDTSCERSCNQR